MNEPYIYILRIAMGGMLTYFVYKDAQKYRIPYKNAWVVGTFIFPLAAVLYVVYKKAYQHRVVLTKKQEIASAQDKQLRERKRELEEERKQYAQKQAQKAPAELAAEEEIRRKKKEKFDLKREFEQEQNSKRMKIK